LRLVLDQSAVTGDLPGRVIQDPVDVDRALERMDLVTVRGFGRGAAPAGVAVSGPMRAMDRVRKERRRHGKPLPGSIRGK